MSTAPARQASTSTIVLITLEKEAKIPNVLILLSVHFPATSNQAQTVEIAKNTPEIAKFMTSEPKKIIYVAGRILNFIV